MVGEIIDDRHARRFAANLRATAHVLEACQRVSDHLSLEAPRVGGDHDGKRIEHIEVAD